MMEENPMHHYDQLSDASDSDDSGSSNNSIGHPPSFRNLNLELKGSIEELKSEFDRNHQTLDDKIKELDDTTDELESMHKNTTVGSLVGSSVGAAGGIAAIAGVCLAPFTLGASLALTVGGAVAGVAGGVTGAASNITNKVRQKTLREKIEKIIHELQNTVNPMGNLVNTIYNITEELNKFDIQRSARGAEDVLKIAAKKICVYLKDVKAAHETAGPVKAKEVHMAAAFADALHAGFLALDVRSVFQDSKEISEMNQSADKRKEEEISSKTLKFILQIKAAADQFKKTVKIIKDVIDIFI